MHIRPITHLSSNVLKTDKTQQNKKIGHQIHRKHYIIPNNLSLDLADWWNRNNHKKDTSSRGVTTFFAKIVHLCWHHGLYCPVKVKVIYRLDYFMTHVCIFPKFPRFYQICGLLHRCTNIKTDNYRKSLLVEQIVGDDGSVRCCPVIHEHRAIHNGASIVAQHCNWTQGLVIVSAEKYTVV